MNTKQTVFVNEYLKCWNASEAARRAGYNGRSNTIGPRLLSDVGIKAEIEQRIAELSMSADEVIVRLTEQARGAYSEYILPTGAIDLPRMINDGKAHLIQEIKHARDGNLDFRFYDAQSALEKLGRHHRLFADNLEVSGPGGKPIEFTEVVVELPNDAMED